MNREDHINYWLNSADEDLKAAETLFHSGKYSWTLFIGHLIIEKALKALYIIENGNKIPPKIHNLVKLSELSNLKLDEEKRILLDEVNDFNLEARYPEFKNEFYKVCTREYAEHYFNKIKEIYTWLKSLIKSE